MFVLIPMAFEIWVDGRDCYLYDHGTFVYMGSIRKGESLPVSQKFTNAYTADGNVWRFESSVSPQDFKSMFNMLDSTVNAYFNEHTMFFVVSYPASAALLEGGRKFNTAYSSGLSANPPLPVLDGVMFEQEGMKVLRQDLQWVPDFTTQPEPGCCWVSNGQWTLWVPTKYLDIFPVFAMEIAMGILDTLGDFLSETVEDPVKSALRDFVVSMSGIVGEPSMCVLFPDCSVWALYGNTWYPVPKIPDFRCETMFYEGYKIHYKQGVDLGRALTALRRTFGI